MVFSGLGVARAPLAAGAVPAPAAAPANSAAAAAGTAGAAPDFSTTNDQEAGVDEPDTVKTDGQLMVILRQQPLGLQVVDVAANPLVLDGFFPLTQISQADGLFLVGQDAVVIGGQTSWLSPTPAGGGGVTQASAAPAARPDAVAGQGQPAMARVNPGGPWSRPPAWSRRRRRHRR